VNGPTPTQSTSMLALEHLYHKLQGGLALRLIPAPSVAFGWKEATKQVNQGPGGGYRVVLQPGDPNGKVGDVEGARLPGRLPDTPLASMIEQATLFIWGYDASDPSELAQWRAVRRLHDVVLAILIRTFRGRWRQIAKTFINSDLERRLGAEMQMTIAVEAMIPDDLSPLGIASAESFTINGEAC
jgi:hypothetical protein